MSQDRRLAAIMFTDFVGYTTQMGLDEERAFEVPAKSRGIHSELAPKIQRDFEDSILPSFTTV